MHDGSWGLLLLLHKDAWASDPVVQACRSSVTQQQLCVRSASASGCPPPIPCLPW